MNRYTVIGGCIIASAVFMIFIIPAMAQTPAVIYDNGEYRRIFLLSNISAGPGGGGGNPFDQSLNTTDSPTFASVTLNGDSNILEGAVIYWGTVTLGSIVPDAFFIDAPAAVGFISPLIQLTGMVEILGDVMGKMSFVNSTGDKYAELNQTGNAGTFHLYGDYPKILFRDNTGSLKSTLSANSGTGQIVYGCPGGFKVTDGADASGTGLISIRGDSLVSIGYYAGSAFPAQLFVTGTYANAPVTVFQARPAQTANVSEWQDSTGAIKAYMDKDFNVHGFKKKVTIMCYAYYGGDGNATRAVWCNSPAQAPQAESSNKGQLATAAPVNGTIISVQLIGRVSATPGSPSMIYNTWLWVRNESTQYNISSAAEFNLSNRWQTYTNTTIRVPVTMGDSIELGSQIWSSPTPSNHYRSAIITIEEA